MNEMRLLLCTDMDRTIIPNGVHAEHPEARKRFADFCRQPEITLVYVTGRHQALVQQAIQQYALPQPDYAITDVGTKIYQADANRWHQWSAWEQEIDRAWLGKSHRQIKQIIGHIPGLYLQEESKQNIHKLSFYLSLSADKDQIIAQMQQCLLKEGIAASLIWSVDEPENIGLLDVLPRNATKLHAIEFLQQQLHFDREQVVFAGDSGNDLPVLGSAIPSVLVANAADEVKQAALQLAEQGGHTEALYLAGAGILEMNGNYSAGVLEGVWHFAPEFRKKLQQSND